MHEEPSKKCAGCSNPLPPTKPGGRPRKWCSERCRRRSYDLACIECGGRVDGSNLAKLKNPHAPRCYDCSHAIAARLRACIEEREDGCWLWRGTIRSNGYGTIHVDGRGRWAHRVSYEHFIGPIPDGLELDHLCRNPPCVNPAHLEPVTHRENVMRSPIALAAINARKTHCKRDHEFTPENTYVQPNGARACRACKAVRRAA